MAVVLDASAVVLALTRPIQAAALHDRIRAELCHAPHLVDAEVGSALRRMVASGQIGVAHAEQLLEDADSLVDRRCGAGPALRRAAWRLRNHVSFYDALYVALAATLGVTMLTADRRLAGSPGLPCTVDLVTEGG